MYKLFFKRIIDIVVAICMLIGTSPFFIFTFLVLFIQNRGKVFFTQERPGYNHKLFKVIKFKTMSDAKNAEGKLLPDHERLTGIGKFFRATSLDELPQLINVLIGDMSLIGPRPLLVKYLPLYSEEQNRRHEVKPGITGWAQVNGRNAISWDKKFEYDVWYVDHLSFGLDVKILFKTIQKVIKKEGINAADAATIEPFDGN